MTQRAWTLSDQAIQQVREVVRAELAASKGGAAGTPMVPQWTSNVYLAESTGSITAMSSETPGQGSVNLLKLVNASTQVTSLSTRTKTVYNYKSSAIASGTRFLAVQDMVGKYWALELAATQLPTVRVLFNDLGLPSTTVSASTIYTYGTDRANLVTGSTQLQDTSEFEVFEVTDTPKSCIKVTTGGIYFAAWEFSQQQGGPSPSTTLTAADVQGSLVRHLLGYSTGSTTATNETGLQNRESQIADSHSTDTALSGTDYLNSRLVLTGTSARMHCAASGLFYVPANAYVFLENRSFYSATGEGGYLSLMRIGASF
jgi:hypothetical protein